MEYGEKSDSLFQTGKRLLQHDSASILFSLHRAIPSHEFIEVIKQVLTLCLQDMGIYFQCIDKWFNIRSLTISILYCWCNFILNANNHYIIVHQILVKWCYVLGRASSVLRHSWVWGSMESVCFQRSTTKAFSMHTDFPQVF